MKELFQAINKELQRYDELCEIIGEDHEATKMLCNEIFGMKKAFQIIAGMSYVEYLFNANNTKLMPNNRQEEVIL